MEQKTCKHPTCHGACRRPVKEKKLYRIPLVSKNRARQLKAVSVKDEEKEMEKWFAYVATVIKQDPHCWNCGEFIPDTVQVQGKQVPTNKFYRAASAHIVPKGIFESVKAHPLNFMVLGSGCGCHDEYDHNLDKACKMPVWKLMVPRFRLIESKITETHKWLDLFKQKIAELIPPVPTVQ